MRLMNFNPDKTGKLVLRIDQNQENQYKLSVPCEGKQFHPWSREEKNVKRFTVQIEVLTAPA